MPSKPKRKPATSRLARVSTRAGRATGGGGIATSQAHAFFWPLVLLALFMWIVYRVLFIFPVWFDETVGKAIFFGLPVWIYIAVSSNYQIVDTFDPNKLRAGLLQGIAFGGVYGFAAVLTSFLASGATVQAAPLFSASTFWWEFGLAIFTGFWETLFFFSFVMLVLMQSRRTWSLLQHILVAAAVFVVFHIPNTVRYFSGTAVLGQLLVLFLFAIGQAFIFTRNKNAYALVLSHAIWGMVLLVHVAF